jgi:magnesium transporter
MITTLVYRDNRFTASNPAPGTLAALRAEPGVMLWVDLDAPTDAEIKLILEATFAFHPLAIEDSVADSPFPKLEDFEDYIYLVMHAVDYSRTDKFTTTELDLFLGKNFLVTFHRQPLKSVQAALDHYLKQPGTAVRGPDRFAHLILDLMVEAYKPATDDLRADLESIEAGVLSHIEAGELFPRVIALRRELASLRQIVRPQREIAATLTQGRNRFIRPVIVPYLRDLGEELNRIETQAGAWVEQLMLVFRVYLNKSDHEANQGIQVLTGLTALTLPAILIGSWYGMNFAHMHELTWAHGYPVALALVLTGTAGMLLFMRKKRWL